jgi:hypothetical protein
MTSQNTSPLVLHVLEHVTFDRLNKATEALAQNAYTISFTLRTDSEIGAYVKNGDGVDYAVTLTKDRAFCSCKDSMFRHMICKHTVATALQALRTPAEQPQVQQPITHLMRLNANTVVCGEPYPERLLHWPWPESIVNNQTQWPEISVCPDCVRERHAPDLRLGKVSKTYDAAA